jgi:hypothetical protein
MKPRFASLLMVVLLCLAPRTASAGLVAPAEPIAPRTASAGLVAPAELITPRTASAGLVATSALIKPPYPPHDILAAPPAAAAQAPADLEYRLAVFYAVPANVPFDPAVLERIRLASLDVQAWYQAATGGLTWEFAFPEIVRVYHAQQTWQYYRQEIDFAVNLPPGGTPPAVAFDVSVAGRRAAFANHTQGAVRYYWTFGDLHVSHQADPVHEYAGDGVDVPPKIRATWCVRISA